MGKKSDVWVSPRGDGWVAQQSGRAISNHRTQAAAIKSGRAEAKRDGVDLVVQRRNGEIGSKDSYGPDPNPPRDREH